jgi:hypothetical protein
MKTKFVSFAIVALLFGAAVFLLSGCTFSNRHGTFTFQPTPEMLERAGIKLHPAESKALKDK